MANYFESKLLQSCVKNPSAEVMMKGHWSEFEYDGYISRFIFYKGVIWLVHWEEVSNGEETALPC